MAGNGGKGKGDSNVVQDSPQRKIQRIDEGGVRNNDVTRDTLEPPKPNPPGDGGGSKKSSE